MNRFSIINKFFHKYKQGAHKILMNSRQYYDGSVGLNYSFARVPMGGTDFSTHTYSYDDADSDPTLANFHLQPEDLQLKVNDSHRYLKLGHKHMNCQEDTHLHL